MFLLSYLHHLLREPPCERTERAPIPKDDEPWEREGYVTTSHSCQNQTLSKQISVLGVARALASPATPRFAALDKSLPGWQLDTPRDSVAQDISAVVRFTSREILSYHPVCMRS
jgi:hypothetical protein